MRWDVPWAPSGQLTEPPFIHPTRTRTRWQSPEGSTVSEPSVDDEGLAAHIVAVGAAEEIDGTGRLRGRAAPPEGNHLAHRGDARALHSHSHLAPLDLDRAGLPLGEGLGEPRLDVAERDAVDRHVVAPPLLRERPGDARYGRLARRVVDLSGIAVRAGRRGDVDDLSHDALALLRLLVDG